MAKRNRRCFCCRDQKKLTEKYNQCKFPQQFVSAGDDAYVVKKEGWSFLQCLDRHAPVFWLPFRAACHQRWLGLGVGWRRQCEGQSATWLVISHGCRCLDWETPEGNRQLEFCISEWQNTTALSKINRNVSWSRRCLLENVGTVQNPTQKI